MKKLFLLAALALGGVLSAYAESAEIQCPDGTTRIISVSDPSNFSDEDAYKEYLIELTREKCDCPDCKVNVNLNIRKDYWEKAGLRTA